jgi:CrcB protein
VTTVLLTLAGGVGAALRLLTDTAARRRWADLPGVGTVAVNLGGSLLLGLLTALVLQHGVTSRLTTIAGTGLCGGYTTFSAASIDAGLKLVQRRTGAAAVVAAANLLGSVAAAAAGYALGSL